MKSELARFKEAKESRFEYPRTYFSGDYHIEELAKKTNLADELECANDKATLNTLKTISLIEKILHLAFDDLHLLCSSNSETHVSRKRILHHFTKTLIDLDVEIQLLGRHTYKEMPLLQYFKKRWQGHFDHLNEKLEPIIQSEEYGQEENYNFTKKTKARYFRVLFKQLEFAWSAFNHADIAESFKQFYDYVRKIQERLEQQRIEDEKKKAAEAEKQNIEEEQKAKELAQKEPIEQINQASGELKSEN